MFKTIIVICSIDDFNDRDHLKALELPSLCSHYIHLDPNNAQDFQRIDQINKNDILANALILAIGRDGLEALCALNRAGSLAELKLKNVSIGLSIHRYFSGIKTLSLVLDFIAIPKTLLDEQAQKVISSISTRVFTLSKPTQNPSVNDLCMAYHNSDISPVRENRYFRDEQVGVNEDEAKPSLSHPYIIVSLPGDVVNINSDPKCFSEVSAQELFESILALRARHGNEHTILVQNSYRTGQFNPQTGLVECRHEYTQGADPKLAIDKISNFFIDLLEKNNIPYHFYNFAWVVKRKSKTEESVYNALLYVALSNPNNYFIVPGDSEKMLLQVPLYLRPEQIIVFKSSSMDVSHYALCESSCLRRHLCFFIQSPEGIKVKPPIYIAQYLMQDDATLVINGIQALSELKKGLCAKISAGIQNLGKWTEVLAAGLIVEAARREYVTPIQSFTACVPLVWLYMYRRFINTKANNAPANQAREANHTSFVKRTFNA